jgi:hypothetical protein
MPREYVARTARLTPFIVNALSDSTACSSISQGCGALISASVVDLHHPLNFRWLHVGNVAVTLSTGVFLATLWKYGHVGHRENGSDASATRSGGWLVVVRNRRLVLYVCASVVLMLGGYGALEAASVSSW